MMARKRSKTRTEDCGKAEAKTRLEDARQQLAYAELHGKNSKPSERKASVATAVLAAIAATDAACCHLPVDHGAACLLVFGRTGLKGPAPGDPRFSRRFPPYRRATPRS